MELKQPMSYEEQLHRLITHGIVVDDRDRAIDIFPEDLFSFNFMDYNTTKGIDFVVDHLGTPKYIELKGTLTKKINHPFRYTYKFICYDIDVNKNEIVEDKEGFYTRLQVIENANFESNDITYNKKMFTGYNLLPEKTTSIQSMEIIVLKSFLTEVLGAVIV